MASNLLAMASHSCLRCAQIGWRKGTPAGRTRIRDARLLRPLVAVAGSKGTSQQSPSGKLLNTENRMIKQRSQKESENPQDTRLKKAEHLKNLSQNLGSRHLKRRKLTGAGVQAEKGQLGVKVGQQGKGDCHQRTLVIYHQGIAIRGKVGRIDERRMQMVVQIEQST